MEVKNNKNYSVLMSVYKKENAENLRESMESIFGQTVKTDDFILVCDGPLNDELNKVIEEMSGKYSEILHVIRLEKNIGLGKALNYGLQYCKHELVARMDSDDISIPERCEKQLEVFKLNPEISIVSGIVEEFTNIPGDTNIQRVLPELHHEIVTFAQNRNPFNHPCVMYKKSSVEMAGGYQDFYLLEDYFLWVRMLINDSKGYNLQIPLLWMRTGNGMYKRRSGLKYAESQIRLFVYMYNKKFISLNMCVINCVIRFISSAMPNSLRKKIYKNKLRK